MSHRIKDVTAKGRYFTLSLAQEAKTVDVRLHRDTVARHRLLNADTIEAGHLERIKEDDLYYRTLDNAFERLSRRPYSEKKLRSALAPDAGAQVLEWVLDYLKHYGYIDDARILERTVDEAVQYSEKGPRLLERELVQEGFAPDDVRLALEAYTDNIQRRKASTLIDEVLAQHQERLPARKLKEKAMQRCMRKGFDREVFERDLEQKIAALGEQLDEDALLQGRMEKLAEKYDTRDAAEKRRMIAKLLREGFSYEMIKKHLE